MRITFALDPTSSEGGGGSRAVVVVSVNLIDNVVSMFRSIGFSLSLSLCCAASAASDGSMSSSCVNNQAETGGLPRI